MSDTSLMFDFVNESTEQIKIASISVINWGPLHGHHEVKIDPEGTLITGDNGAGKSTLVDALMTLLRPSGSVSYNIAAAQDGKKDRSIVTYIRGSYGNSMVDGTQVTRNLRENSVISAVKAVYEFTSSKRQVVLLGIFSIKGESNANADVRKIYALANQDIDIIAAVNAFKSLELKPLKGFLQRYDNCHVYENFTEYETAFRMQLRMDNSNAPALLSRALGLKRIDDLTALIRTLVLEKGSLDADARDAIASFEDLKAIHEILIDLFNQEKELKDLPEKAKLYEELTQNIALLSSAESSLNSYAAGFAVKHYLKSEQNILLQKERLAEEIKYTEEDKLKAEADKNTKFQLYLENGGTGSQNLEQQLAALKREEKKTSDNLTGYNRLVSNLGFNLKTVSAEDDYEHNLALIPEITQKIDDERVSIVESITDLKVKEKNFCDEKAELKLEKDALIKRGDSNLDKRYQFLRQEISNDLSISEDSLVYIAELIEVKDEYKKWQGAIERALGGRRQTLLVSQENYKTITAYLNSRFFKGIHIRVQVAKEQSDNTPVFGNQGYLNRLIFKNHPFTPFLKEYLIEYDLTCVDSIEKLNETEFSMTVEGMIHYRGGYFDKKDLYSVDDRHEWCTGFSNRAKLKLVEEDLLNLDKELSKLAVAREQLNASLKANSLNGQNLTLLSNIRSFKEIDVKSVRAEILKVEDDLQKLLNNPDVLKLKKALDEAQAKLNQLENELKDLNRQDGTYNQQLSDIRHKIEDQRKIADAPVAEEAAVLIDTFINRLKLNFSNFFEAANLNNVGKAIADDIASKNEKYRSVTNSINRIISAFDANHKEKTSEWGNDLESYPYYLRYLDRIRKDNLPKQLDKFKAHLTQTGTESVVAIVSKANTEISSIKDRIKAVNEVLKKAEFTENTYLEIEAKPISYPSLKDYEDDTRAVMKAIQSDDHEDRYRKIARVINSLTDALSSGSIEKKAILDTRLRLQFIAHVVDRTTNQISDTMTSSSGKSGGEKESFAGSVLAASLAYVLTPEQGQFPTYCSVFLDEAFSNTSDKVSSRVLQTFKELKLHVNLITPFKNIGVSREYTKTLIMLSKNESTHVSTTNTLSWEEYDENKQQLNDDALKELGMTVNEDNKI